MIQYSITQMYSTQCFKSATRETIRENITAIPETAGEKAAPVSIDGAGAIALSLADAVVVSESTTATNMIIMPLEKQSSAISKN
ncbi:hypothetical protein E1A91_D01G152800v1 [Gossypium mustelinum]|uniref:Uncharacterized protein n=2 Tax=Gossypium TaxID=3633 RepID=A0A5J5SNK7_GOSBA|nr:hypothetical protein ES319_D01G146000v1 [Gossypium barbadense]TYI97587.1 hypothetical protein E1A91_D01G152800v1 [Gossypium mustelinum]